jgi:hypothetical protein
MDEKNYYINYLIKDFISQHLQTTKIYAILNCGVIWEQPSILLKWGQLPCTVHGINRSKYVSETSFHKFSYLKEYCRHTCHKHITRMKVKRECETSTSGNIIISRCSILQSHMELSKPSTCLIPFQTHSRLLHVNPISSLATVQKSP